jgi:hypothetical protein
MQMRRGSILSLREIGVCESQGRSAIGVTTVLLALVLQHQQHVVEANPLLLEHFATLSPSAASFDLRGLNTNAPWPSSINENLSPARKLYFPGAGPLAGSARPSLAIESSPGSSHQSHGKPPPFLPPVFCHLPVLGAKASGGLFVIAKDRLTGQRPRTETHPNHGLPPVAIWIAPAVEVYSKCFNCGTNEYFRRCRTIRPWQ